jgi:hypothetical protein
MLSRLHFAFTLLVLLAVGATEVFRIYVAAPPVTQSNPSVRENPASYRPVYVPILRGGSGGGSSGGWSGGK